MKRLIKTKKSRVVAVVATVTALLTVTSLLAVFFPKRPGNTANGGGSGGLIMEPVYGERMCDYSLLYDNDHLIACYMGYDATSLTVENVGNGETVYKWRNYVGGGEDAVLYGGSLWKTMNGGIGYNMTLEESKAYSAGCNIPYDLSYDAMPNYRIEIVSSVRGLSDAKGDPLYVDPIERPYNVTKTHQSGYRFGGFHSLSYVADNNLRNTTYANSWFLSNEAYKYHVRNEGVGNVYIGDDYVRADLYGKALYMIVQQSTVNEGTEYVDFSIDYLRRGDPAPANPAHQKVSVTKRFSKTAFIEHLAAKEYKDEASPFSLMNSVPGVLYSVRVYDKTFEGNEYSSVLRRNYFVDLLAFYKINVGSLLNIEKDKLGTILSRCGDIADNWGIELKTDNFEKDRANVFSILNEYMK